MMSEAVEWMWICTGGYGWLRGKWVNSACCHKVSYLHVESHCLCVSRGFVILFGDSCKVEKMSNNLYIVLNLYNYRQLSQICILLVLSLIRDFKQFAMATSTTAVVDGDSRGEYVTVAHEIFLLQATGVQTLTTGFLAHLLLHLVKCREDIISE